jgi:hypothetical protein
MPKCYAMTGGKTGTWAVTSMRNVRGDGLTAAERIDISPIDLAPSPAGASWTLRGLISNIRYAERAEIAALKARQEGLGRPNAIRAALIPIRKSPAWWDLAQDERRAIFEETSHHTAIGMAYLPTIARQLYHCRDLGEPFDFLTWFEYAPEHATAFEDLVAKLRDTHEWTYVDREVDIRLARTGVHQE